MKKLKIVLPKGSLQETTLSLFRKAGMEILTKERLYKPICEDEELEITFVRAQEIPKYVEIGTFDCGITGYDWICETGADVKEVCELRYSKSGFGLVKWVVAVANDSSINSISDLQGKKISTELVNVTKKFLKEHKINCDVDFSWGATEVKVPELVDAIVELTDTGESLRAHNLKIIHTILKSTPRFISNWNSWKNPWKRKKMEEITILLKGVLLAENMVGLKMNVKRKDLKKVLKILPALKKPTISPLSDKNWVAIEVVSEKKKVRELIPRLKLAGAQGIIEYPLHKVIT